MTEKGKTGLEKNTKYPDQIQISMGNNTAAQDRFVGVAIWLEVVMSPAKRCIRATPFLEI